MQKNTPYFLPYHPLRRTWVIGLALWLGLVLVAPGWVRAAPTVVGSPSLTITSKQVDLYKTDGFSVPINFQSNGNPIASIAFILDYDQTCLTFDNTGGELGGTPNAVHFTLPPGFAGSARFTAANTSGEFKFLIIPPSGATPLPSLVDGDIITIDFGVQNGCYSLANPFHPVSFNFSGDSFGDTSGHKVTGATTNGTYTLHFINHPPVANAQSVTTNEDTPKSITLTGSDPEGSSLTYSVVAQPTNGTLSGTAPNLTYTPNANYNGADSFTFKVNDGNDDSAAATVSITVSPVNDAPVAAAQSVSTNEDTAASITLSGSDVDGNPLTYSVVTQPANGTLSGTAPNLTYTPNANYNGADSFTFKVNDGTVDSNVATVSITINPVNDAPVADAQSVTTNEDTPKSITLTGSDIEGSSLTYSVVAQPTNGTLSGTAPNLTYTPNANYNGADSFTFKVNDGTVDSAANATVSITVSPVNDAPVADAQSVATDEDTAKSITLTGSDVDGNPLTYSVVAQPTNGTLSGTAPNLTYTPNANYNGLDSFTFKVNDGTVDSNVATVSITINPINDAPVAVDDPNPTLVVLGDGISTTPISVLSNDTDVENNALSVNTITQGAQGGTVTNNTTNVTYKAPTLFSGVDTFTYAAQDNGTPPATSNNATVSVNVVANDPRGDCNADGGINAGDFPAVVLEIFDVDTLISWWKTYTGAFVGSPLGCDANNSKNGPDSNNPADSVNAADISCTVLIYFDGNPACSTTGSPIAANKAATATLQIDANLKAKQGEMLDVPITLEVAGNHIAAAAFALDFDEANFHFDPADSNNDGIPDAIHFNTSARFTTIVHYNTTLSRVEVAVFGVTVPLPLLDSGVVATVTLQANATSNVGSAALHLVKASLGNDQGRDVPLAVVDQDAQIIGQTTTKAIFLPLVMH